MGKVACFEGNGFVATAAYLGILSGMWNCGKIVDVVDNFDVLGGVSAGSHFASALSESRPWLTGIALMACEPRHAEFILKTLFGISSENDVYDGGASAALRQDHFSPLTRAWYNAYVNIYYGMAQHKLSVQSRHRHVASTFVGVTLAAPGCSSASKFMYAWVLVGEEGQAVGYQLTSESPLPGFIPVIWAWGESFGSVDAMVRTRLRPVHYATEPWHADQGGAPFKGKEHIAEAVYSNLTNVDACRTSGSFVVFLCILDLPYPGQKNPEVSKFTFWEGALRPPEHLLSELPALKYALHVNRFRGSLILADLRGVANTFAFGDGAMAENTGIAFAVRAGGQQVLSFINAGSAGGFKQVLSLFEPDVRQLLDPYPYPCSVAFPIFEQTILWMKQFSENQFTQLSVPESSEFFESQYLGHVDVSLSGNDLLRMPRGRTVRLNMAVLRSGVSFGAAGPKSPLSAGVVQAAVNVARAQVNYERLRRFQTEALN